MRVGAGFEGRARVACGGLATVATAAAITPAARVGAGFGGRTCVIRSAGASVATAAAITAAVRASAGFEGRTRVTRGAEATSTTTLAGAATSATLAGAAAVAVVALVALVVAASACAPLATARRLVSIDRAHDIVVVRDATVFPATSTERLVDFDVVVVDGKIAAVQPTGASIPVGARVIEGRGRTLLPGLVDAHVHVMNGGAPPWREVRVPPEHNLEAYLYAGITTVYDLGGDGEALEKLQRAITAGAIPGPRLFHTDLPITGPHGHPIPLIEATAPWPLSALAQYVVPQANGPDDAAKLITNMLAHDADYVKLMRDAAPTGSAELSDASLAALVLHAHAQGKKVFVHVGTVDDALAAARAGADVLAHGVYRGTIDRDQAAELARRHVKVIFTLASFRHIAALAHHRVTATALDEETAPPEVLTPVLGDNARALDDYPDAAHIVADAAASEAKWNDNLRTMHDAGVEIVPGSDSTMPAVMPGGTLHEDMAALVAAGMTPSEVLREATYGAAHLFLPDPTFGTIEPGKSADLLLVDGDPFANIDATTHIAAVIRAGHVVERVPR